MFGQAIIYVSIGAAVVLALSGTLRTYAGDFMRHWAKETFFVANRSLGFWRGWITIAMNWTQTPVFLASGSLAFVSPYHFLSFLMGNVLTLVVMGILAPHIHRLNPDGFTTPELMWVRFRSRGIRYLYDFSSIGALTIAVAYTITGLQQWIAPQLQVSFGLLWLSLTGIALLCALPRGILGVINFDIAKWVIVTAAMLGIVMFHRDHGTPHALQQLATVPVNWMVLWMVALPFAVSWLGGPLCNPDLSQRVRMIETKHVRKAYFMAAAFFAVTVIAFADFGTIAKSMGLAVSAVEPPAYAVIKHAAPDWLPIVTIAFLFVIMATFMSQLDGAGTFFAMEGRQFWSTANDRQLVARGRLLMIVPILMGAFIALLNIDLSLLVQNMAVVRGPVVIPVIIGLFGVSWASKRAVFWGIALGMISSAWLTFFLPLTESMLGMSIPFAAEGRPWGALCALLVPGIVIIFGSLRRH